MKESLELRKNATQGFLTSKDNFLTRSEALELAIKTGQSTSRIIGSVLTSEDLW
jgi:hypothetical protein